MIILDENKIKSFDIKNTALTIGVFDGVHIGHRMILEELKSLSSESGLKNIVITLSPDPEEILHPQTPFTILTSIEDKISELQELDIDYCYILETNEKLLSYSAVEFFEKFIYKKFFPSLIVIGEDFRFGKNKEGDINLLEELAGKYNFRLYVLPFLKMKGAKVGSSRIRKALIDGDIESASYMLGRFPKLSGRVVPGEGRGRRLGFPTANILTNCEFRLKKGVYIGEVIIKEKQLPALLYVGTSPTFGGKFLRYEIYIPDFRGYLYGKSISFLIQQMLRGEKVFINEDAICSQLEVDRECLIKHFTHQNKG